MSEADKDTQAQQEGAGAENEVAANEAGSANAAELEAELAQVKERMLRVAADAENTRKRAEREIQQAREYAIEGFAKSLLSVADNLSRALSALDDQSREGMSEAGRNLVEGIAMTEKEMQAALQRHGVTQVGDADAPFDPNLHQAVAQIPDTKPANAIVEIVQTGYLLNGRVLRPAMVIVSAGPGEEAG